MSNLENPATSIEVRANEAGISINELCKEADVNRSTFTRWKNGTTSPTFSHITKFEKALEKLSKPKRKSVSQIEAQA